MRPHESREQASQAGPLPRSKPIVGQSSLATECRKRTYEACTNDGYQTLTDNERHYTPENRERKALCHKPTNLEPHKFYLMERTQSSRSPALTMIHSEAWKQYRRPCPQYFKYD